MSADKNIARAGSLDFLLLGTAEYVSTWRKFTARIINNIDKTKKKPYLTISSYFFPGDIFTVKGVSTKYYVGKRVFNKGGDKTNFTYEVFRVDGYPIGTKDCEYLKKGTFLRVKGHFNKCKNC